MGATVDGSSSNARGPCRHFARRSEKVAKDPDLLAEAKKLRIEITHLRGEHLQSMAKEVMTQPPEVVEQIKKLFVQ